MQKTGLFYPFYFLKYFSLKLWPLTIHHPVRHKKCRRITCVDNICYPATYLLLKTQKNVSIIIYYISFCEALSRIFINLNCIYS